MQHFRRWEVEYLECGLSTKIPSRSWIFCKSLDYSTICHCFGFQADAIATCVDTVSQLVRGNDLGMLQTSTKLFGIEVTFSIFFIVQCSMYTTLCRLFGLMLGPRMRALRKFASVFVGDGGHLQSTLRNIDLVMEEVQLSQPLDFLGRRS